MVKAGRRGGQVREAGLAEPSRDPASRGSVGHGEGCGRPFTAVGSFWRVLNKAATGSHLLFEEVYCARHVAGASEAWLKERARRAASTLWTRGEGKPTSRSDRARVGPGPPRHTAARGPRSESLTSNPKQPSPDPTTEGRGGCPHSGDARSTAQLIAEGRERLWETKGAEALAGSRPLTVRAQPASEAETWAQGPTSGRTHRGVRWWLRPAQPRARLHTGQEPARRVRIRRGRCGHRGPPPGVLSPTASAVCLGGVDGTGPGAAGARGREGGRGGTESLQGSDVSQHRQKVHQE